MQLVFKTSLAILAVAAVAGQAWMHDKASPDGVAQIARMARECPSLAIEAGRGTASKATVVMVRDAYWRTIVAGAIAGKNGCAVDAARKTA